MIYYLTPLIAAGPLNKNEIEGIDTNFKQNLGLMPNDISSEVTKNVCDDFTLPNFDVIKRLATKNRLFVRDNMRVPDNKIEIFRFWLILK